MKCSTILRVFSFILAAVLTYSMLSLAIAATGEEHTHRWNKTGTTPATCTEDEKVTYICSICKKTKEETKGSALGHSWSSWKTAKSATCTQAGSEERTCSRCGKKETRSVAAKGHSFKYLRTEKEATCTENGIALYTCPQCSAKENRVIKAQGHDWDEGEITAAPGFLEPGIKTYTCRNCGDTRTEEIPTESAMTGSAIMELLRNGFGGADETFGADELRIVTQPEGGFISHDGGSIRLSVEAEGGTEPYTYIWRRRYNSIWAPFFPWRTVESTEGNTCQADLGNYVYYCRVYDDAGHKVSSDWVTVDYDLYISRQPKNANLYGKNSVTLSCKAAGGEPYSGGTYLYAWYNEAGSQISLSDTGEVEVSGMGEYYCTVEDLRSGPLASEKCTVYSTDPLRIPYICATQYLLEGEESSVWGAVHGGVEPYTVSWSRDGEELPTELGDDGYYRSPVTGKNLKETIYTLTATDAMKDTVSVSVKVCYRQLKIARQPENGMLASGGGCPLELEMAEGEAPFSYSVYRNGELVQEYQSTRDYTSYSVTRSGEYYYHIIDSTGRWADSDPVFVEDYTFRLDRIDVSGELQAPGDRVTLTAVTNGGKEPITYEWWHFAPSTAIATRLAETSSSCSTEIPGTYRCYVKDAEQAEGWNMVYVRYTGSAPIITGHPQKITLKYDPDPEKQPGELSCAAMAADGRTDCLSYIWEYKTDAGWSESGDKGSTVSVRYNPSVYSWRCVVTDTRSGERTVSREGCVSTEVYCTIVSVAGDMKTSKKITVRYTVKGGTAPYTVSVSGSRVTGKTGGQEKRFSSLFGTDFIFDNKVHDYVIRNDDPAYQYFVRESGGSYNAEGTRPDIYLTVEDAGGNIYSTDYYGQ